MLFIQRRYFILAQERVKKFFSLLLRILSTTVILLFHGYQYEIFQILNFIVIYFFTLKTISGERDRNVHNVFISCVINFSINMKLLVILFITELQNFLVRQGDLSVLIRFFQFLRKEIKSSCLFTNYSNQRCRLNPSKTL